MLGDPVDGTLHVTVGRSAYLRASTAKGPPRQDESLSTSDRRPHLTPLRAENVGTGCNPF
jgi:hypothetical protein